MTRSISSLVFPWHCICATGDMLDPEPCDLLVPSRWRSSITPFAPELEVKLRCRAADMLEEAFPCQGGLLHVTMAPLQDARGGDRNAARFAGAVDLEGSCLCSSNLDPFAQLHLPTALERARLAANTASRTRRANSGDELSAPPESTGSLQ